MAIAKSEYIVLGHENNTLIAARLYTNLENEFSYARVNFIDTSEKASFEPSEFREVVIGDSNNKENILDLIVKLNNHSEQFYHNLLNENALLEKLKLANVISFETQEKSVLRMMSSPLHSDTALMSESETINSLFKHIDNAEQRFLEKQQNIKEFFLQEAPMNLIQTLETEAEISLINNNPEPIHKKVKSHKLT